MSIFAYRKAIFNGLFGSIFIEIPQILLYDYIIIRDGLFTSISNESAPQIVSFTLGDMMFEYDERKNQKNIVKHGISFTTAARVFFDYDRIEYYDKANSYEEDRYDTIGDTSAGAVNLEHSNWEVLTAGNMKQSIG